MQLIPGQHWAGICSFASCDLYWEIAILLACSWGVWGFIVPSEESPVARLEVSHLGCEFTNVSFSVFSLAIRGLTTHT